MLIKDLPPKIRKLAIRRALEDIMTRTHYGVIKKILNQHVSHSFTWSRTKEGGIFWSHVDDGIYPHHLYKKKLRILKYIKR